jgi:hypothetical protein
VSWLRPARKGPPCPPSRFTEDAKKESTKPNKKGNPTAKQPLPQESQTVTSKAKDTDLLHKHRRAEGHSGFPKEKKTSQPHSVGFHMKEDGVPLAFSAVFSC